jgi:hypothetical protein
VPVYAPDEESIVFYGVAAFVGSKDVQASAVDVSTLMRLKINVRRRVSLFLNDREVIKNLAVTT